MKNRIIILIYLFISLFIYSEYSHSQKIVACIGNSITYGYGIENPDINSYPAQLQKLLGDKWKVINYGVSARTLLKNGDRPYWDEPAYTSAKKSNPDVVIIKLGTNDSKLQLNWNDHKNEFIDDYKAMIQSFRNQSSDPEIWICLVVPAYKDIWDISDVTIKNEVNPKIFQVALSEGVGLIDLYTVMSNKKDMFLPDGIHPNAAGAAEMAKVIHAIITKEKPVIIVKGKKLIAPKAYDYQWYRDNKTVDKENGGKNRVLKFTEPGKYKVSLKISEENDTRILSEVIVIDNLTSQLNVEQFEVYNIYLPRQGAKTQ